MSATLSESLRTALDGLVANKLRSSLTMLGVIIGVAAVVALLSIGAGAQSAITSRISSAGTNLVFVSPGSSSGRAAVRGPQGSAITLTYEDAQAIADPSNVQDALVVAPEFSSRAQVVYGSANDNVSVTGVTPEYGQAFNAQVASGRFITASDVAGDGNVAVLGYQVAQNLFGGFDPLGKRVRLSPMGGAGVTPVMVVGVLAEQGGSMIANTDDTVYVPITTAQTSLFQGRNALGQTLVTRINVVAATSGETSALQQQITDLLAARHRLGAGESPDFTVQSQAQMVAMATQVSGVLTLFLGAIAGVSLLVGGIGIMNIMLVAVTERTHEIGLRKALGARHADILVQFLLESVVLSALGGVVGVLAGFAIAKVVDLSGLMNAVTPLYAVLLAVGAALAVGLFFGIYPANRAAGLSPIEALRYE